MLESNNPAFFNRFLITDMEIHNAIVQNITNPEALDFLKLHNEMVHAVDDIIDEPGQPPAQKLNVFRILWRYYNHPYYLRHASSGLNLLSLLNQIDYENSVKWEHSNVAWKVEAAKTLRHTSISMLFAVLAIECGAEKASELSEAFRAYTFEKHKDDKEFLCLSSTDTKSALA